MSPIFASVPTLAVSMIFCAWSAYRQFLWRRHQTLRERVAFMLWTMAKQVS